MFNYDKYRIVMKISSITYMSNRYIDSIQLIET